VNTQPGITTTPTTKIKVIDFGDEELIFAPYSGTVDLDGEEVEVSVLHDSWGRVDSLDEHDPVTEDLDDETREAIVSKIAEDVRRRPGRGAST
jgi:hypothetical protein